MGGLLLPFSGFPTSKQAGAKILIIGAGMSGASTAYHLMQAGF